MRLDSHIYQVPPQAPRNVLETYSPPCHCFPAPYTSHSRVTSEMKRIDQGFFDASWLLRKSSTAVSRTSPCDMDELSERFSQLSVRGEGSFRHHSEPAHHPLQPPAATASYIIQTCSAPHPALIRRPIIPQHSPARRYLANAAASTSQFISPHKFSYPSFGTVKRRSILAREKCRRIVSSSQWQAAQVTGFSRYGLYSSLINQAPASIVPVSWAHFTEGSIQFFTPHVNTCCLGIISL